MSKSTISTFELFQMFPDQESARTYFDALAGILGLTRQEVLETRSAEVFYMVCAARRTRSLIRCGNAR